MGLGNPGLRYRESLHNVGFKVVEKLSEECGFSWKYDSRFHAEVSKGVYAGVVYHLLRPETFMNLSGEAVGSYATYYQLNADQLIVIADDADLKIGEMRLKPFGGSGGHNGLKSIAKKLADFKRLRIGIGRPDNAISLADYVLMQQSMQVWEELNPVILRAALLLKRLANEPFENVMKDANTSVQKLDGEMNETR